MSDRVPKWAQKWAQKGSPEGVPEGVPEGLLSSIPRILCFISSTWNSDGKNVWKKASIEYENSTKEDAYTQEALKDYSDPRDLSVFVCSVSFATRRPYSPTNQKVSWGSDI